MIHLERRNLLWVALAAACLVSFFGWWSRYEVRRTIESELEGQLQTILDANVTALDLWIKNQERLVEVIANDPEVRRLAIRVLDEADAAGTNGLQRIRFPDRVALQTALDERIKQTGYLTAQLVATNCMVVGSSTFGRQRVGSPIPEAQGIWFNEVFSTGESAIVTPFKVSLWRPGQARGAPRFSRPRRSPAPTRRAGPGGARPLAGAEPDRFQRGNGPRRWQSGQGRAPAEFSLMQVVAPIKNEGGSVVAALAFILRPEAEFTKVLSVARTGETGETFAFDASGLMISQSRFDDQLKAIGLLDSAPSATSALTLELLDPGVDLTLGKPVAMSDTQYPLTHMVDHALAEGAGVSVKPIRDYRGVPVVGAWRWLPEHGFGVATKIDASEAFQSLFVLRVVFISLLLVLILCVLAIVLVSYLNLHWRRRLNEAQLKARQLGQYTLDEKIGKGGMGLVYRARHALLRRETAVKLLLPDRASQAAIQQFEHEVRLTCQLTHPNTIQIYDYGHTPDGIFYYAMELLDGLTVSDLLARYGPAPEERVLHVLLQACASLREAHAAGLIHRDIKPSNLFLCDRGGIPDTLKVLDFGLVRRLGDKPGDGLPSETQNGTSTLLGTPMYMAPEVIRDPDAADERSDIYALGAVGYHMLTGESVFDAKSVEELLELHLHSTPKPLSESVNGSVSPELKSIIHRCLEKDPASRPRSVGELHEALARCPNSTAWTFERRVAWWNTIKEHAIPPEDQKPRADSTSVDATLRIDLEQRSPDPLAIQ